MKRSPYYLVVTALLLIVGTTPAAAYFQIHQTAGYGYDTATSSWNLQDVAWGLDASGNLNNSTALTFNNFDGSLGTLVSASLSIYANASGLISVTNTSASTSTIRQLKNGVTVYYQLPVDGLKSNALTGPSYATLLSKITLAGGTTYTSGLATLTPTVNPDVYSYDQTNDTFFIGTSGSTFTIPVGTNNLSTITYLNGNPIISFTNKSGIYATLDYLYSTPSNVVPEPSTYLLLGIALGVVGIARRKMMLRNKTQGDYHESVA